MTDAWETASSRARPRRLGGLGLLVLALAILAPACGEPEAPGSLGPAATSQTGHAATEPAVDRALRSARPAAADGMAIWVRYATPETPSWTPFSRRRREEARALARRLRERVLAGAPIGPLARRHSNAPGGVAEGFTGWVRHPEGVPPDPREQALLATPVGEVTPLVEWQDGFWFARRVSEAEAAALARTFERRVRERAVIDAIFVAHAGLAARGVLGDEDQVARTHEEALDVARWLLDRALAGEDFSALARAHSDDKRSAARGGRVVAARPDGSSSTTLGWGEPYVDEAVIEAAFSTPEGEVHPKVLDTPRGVFLVRVVERFEAQ